VSDTVPPEVTHDNDLSPNKLKRWKSLDNDNIAENRRGV